MRTIDIYTVIAIVAMTVGSATCEFLRVCYFPSWARYRTNIARYEVGDVDPNLCTHLIYAFGKLDMNTKQLIAADHSVEEGANGKFSQFNSLKSRNPSLKTLISIGGQNAHGDEFKAITSTDAILQNFSTSAVQFLRSRGFDGLDVDWEYPSNVTKSNFTNLLKSLRMAFDADINSPKLLLTFAGPAGQWNIDPGFDVKEIIKYVDFAILMTYDYTDAYAAVTSFNSPLYSRNDAKFNPSLSTNWTVHYWNSLGIPFSKIVVGVTGVGRRLVLQNVSNTDPGSNVTGQVREGKYYSIEAGLAYPEICELLANTYTRRQFDDQQKNPYMVNGDDWVGYEDKESLEAKIQWMTNLGVAGLMFWSLDQDDFTGQLCNEGKYPLLNYVISKTTTATPAPLTTKAPTTGATTGEFLRVCYFPSWTRYRSTIARFEVGDIDPSLCTHLIYAFGQLDVASKTLIAHEASTEEGQYGKFRQFNDLKISNPSLKTLISIGGQNDDGRGFLAIAETDDVLNNFSASTVKFLRERGFNGLDIDWEYPNTDTRSTFVRILKVLRSAFNADTAGSQLLLTFAGPAGQWNIDPGYDVQEIEKYVDFVNLMTYDYTDKLAKVTAFNSPLYSRNDSRFNPTLSTNWTVHYWNGLGMPLHKIVVGITGVGRMLVLQDETNTSPGSNVTGEVRSGQYYRIEAGMAYPEICEMLKNSSTKRTFDEVQYNPYLVNGDTWVGYEDKQSIRTKLEWMRSLGVAGVMFWSLDQDDFTGQMCADGRFPLLNLIKTETAVTSSTTSTNLSTTAATTVVSTTIVPETGTTTLTTTTGTNNFTSGTSTPTTMVTTNSVTNTGTNNPVPTATTTYSTSSVPTTVTPTKANDTTVIPENDVSTKGNGGQSVQAVCGFVVMVICNFLFTNIVLCP